MWLVDAAAGAVEVVVEAATGIAVETSVRPEWSWGRSRKGKRCIGCEGVGKCGRGHDRIYRGWWVRDGLVRIRKLWC